MDTNTITAAAASLRTPLIPRSTGYAWRVAPWIDGWQADVVLRLFGSRRLRLGADLARLTAMGLPVDVTAHALRRVRSVHDWDIAWTWAAQRFLGEARVQHRSGHEHAAALSEQHAALAYHLAGMLVFDEPRKTRALRASASTLYARAMPILRPAVRKVDVPWRTSHLPGYLTVAENSHSPAPLVVILNGTSTSKEETLLWSGQFLEHNFAVLALDWPGSGESSLSASLTPDCDDFTEGVFTLASADPTIDASRIALVGFSLGGAVAALVAANDRRIGAVVAVTPPFDLRPWITMAQPLLRRHLATIAGGEEHLMRLAAGFALPGIVERVKCPMLVMGAGRDLIVPPEEAVRYCFAAGERGTLLWYPDGRHGLYAELEDWTAESARWLRSTLVGNSSSTQVDELVQATRVEQ